MSQEKQSASEANFEEANRIHNEACKAAASSGRRQAGDPPSALDSALGNHVRSDVNPIKPVFSTARYTPTPGLDPGCITALSDGDELLKGYLAPAENAFSTMFETLKAVSLARDPLSRDTSKTPEQKLLTIAAHAEKAFEKATRVSDTAYKNLTTAAKALDESLSKPLESVTHTALSQEIRSHIKSLPKEERGEFVGEALKRGDMQVLNSVLGAPSYLSGIHDAQKATFLRTFHEQRNPQEVKRLAAYQKAITLLMERSQVFIMEREKAMGGKWSDVMRLRGQVDASAKALAAIGE